MIIEFCVKPSKKNDKISFVVTRSEEKGGLSKIDILSDYPNIEDAYDAAIAAAKLEAIKQQWEDNDERLVYPKYSKNK